MERLRSIFAAKSQVKIGLLTFITLFTVFLVFTAWQRNTWATVRSQWTSLEAAATSEDVDYTQSGFKIYNESALAMPISNNTRPAVVAAGMKADDLYWMDEIAHECAEWPQAWRASKADRSAAGMSTHTSLQTPRCLRVSRLLRTKGAKQWCT